MHYTLIHPGGRRKDMSSCLFVFPVLLSGISAVLERGPLWRTKNATASAGPRGIYINKGCCISSTLHLETEADDEFKAEEIAKVDRKKREECFEGSGRQSKEIETCRVFVYIYIYIYYILYIDYLHNRQYICIYIIQTWIFSLFLLCFSAVLLWFGSPWWTNLSLKESSPKRQVVRRRWTTPKNNGGMTMTRFP